MEHVETEEFKVFKEYHFNSREIESYRMLVDTYLEQGNRKGLVEGYIYKDEQKKYHLYFFKGSKAFYTVAAHLERKGEPKKEFSENLKNYLIYLEKEGRS